MQFKTSLLVERQLPEFVRDEYPLFVSFLEAYYEFLETEKYTDGISQKNNLIEKLKDIRNISDVDFSLSDFEEQFFNTFLSYLPKNTPVDKAFLIKNILPLYQSKGTQKSFEFLFRLLFGEEIQIEYPGDKVLRASSGKWVIENILRTEIEIYSEYVSDGETFVYNLPYEMDTSLVRVFVDGNLSENYYVRKELQKIYFNIVPSLNSIIKVEYLGNFNTLIFRNRKITGLTSGATAIIEKVARRNINGLNFYQFFIDRKNIVGTFSPGELIVIDVFNANQQLVTFHFQTLSDIDSITVLNPGRDYSVGDEVIIRGTSAVKGTALVDQVSSGNIDNIFVDIGAFGAGYQIGNEVYANGYSNTIFSATIDAVDDSGSLSPNTISFNTLDIIDDYLSLNISDPNYGFPANTIPSENVNSIIADCLTYDIITDLGPATNVFVNLSQITSNTIVDFIANSSILYDNVTIKDYGAIGTIKINEPGTGYSIGDNIVFMNTEYFSGQGAKAIVSDVDDLGRILRVTVQDGGYNYRKDYLPLVDVESLGTGANLEVQHLMGDGAQFDYELGDGIPGKVLSIKLITPGRGYTATPFADLKFSGDGKATANVTLRPSFVESPGKWITTDGLLSTDDIRLQGKNYFIDFSYIITSQVEFQRYKSVIKDLLNPVGTIAYSRYSISQNVDTEFTYIVFDEFRRQLAGQVNVISELINVYGNENVYFNVANTINLVTEGTVIMVNSEIRIVNSIINNTTITVSEPFEYSANDQFVTILSLPYRSITTEYWRELAISLEGPRTIAITTED